MHLILLFHNIGGYHAARLRATQVACMAKGWKLTALQIIGRTQEHPWGNMEEVITFPLQTLLNRDLGESEENHKLVKSRLVTALNCLQPDIVAIPGWGFPSSRAALSWCRRYRVPTILMSESKADDEIRRWWKEVLKSWLYIRHYDAALVGSQHHAEYLMKLGFLPQKIFQGYDAVDNDYFANQADRARLSPAIVRQRQPKIPNRPYFLAVTRFIPRKNLSRVIDAYASYHGQVKDAWDLVLCGGGIEEASLKQHVHQLKLHKRIHFPGFVPYTAIGTWYGLANVFIHPALQEQWGLVVNEACAAGLPILCSQTVGARYDLVQEHMNGLLFDPTSTQDITRCLISIHKLDKIHRSQWGETSRKIVSIFHPEKFAEGMIQAAKEALN
jgi:1,2-diacylglycerol 3-alpha-glucosyltransferase